MTSPLFRPTAVTDSVPTITEPPAANPIVVSPAISIVTITDDQIEQLGERTTAQLATVSKQMMSSIKASDTDVFGQKLNELVGVAKGLNPSNFQKGGIMGKLNSLFGSTKDKMMSQYSTVEQRMNALIAELDDATKLHTQRVGDLEQMYESNFQTHQQLEQAALQGNTMAEAIKIQIAASQTATDAFAAQNVADLTNRLDRLEKRIDDINRSMLLAKQAAPQIRLMQDNARSLASKFKDVKAVTIPAWQNAFALYLMQLEQQKGAQLANAVHDATDEAFRMQADMLRQNTQEIAKAKQRSVVTIETLQHVQDQLLGAFDDMTAIAVQEKQSRKDAEVKIKALEQQLVDRFVGTQHN